MYKLSEHYDKNVKMSSCIFKLNKMNVYTLGLLHLHNNDFDKNYLHQEQ